MIVMVKKLILIVAFILFTLNANSQQNNSPFTIGLFGGYSLNFHSADFKAIPDCPSCSPGYKNGFGSRPGFGALFEYKLSQIFTLAANLSYNDISALLKSEEPVTVILQGIPTNGAFEQSIDTKLSTLGIEPMLKVAFFDNFSFNVGIFAGKLINKNYSQKEVITKPEGEGTFTDQFGNDSKSRIRNQFSGVLSKATSLMISPGFGLSYNLALNKSKNLTLEPMLQYSLGLSNIVNDPVVNKWKVNDLKIAMALKYTLLEERELIKRHEKLQKIDTIEIKKELISASYISKGLEIVSSEDNIKEDILLTTETMRRIDTLFIPKVYQLSADISAVGVDAAGNEIQNPKVIVEEFISNKLKPLLNYIFFDENSSQIPSKYKLFDKKEATNFHIDNLYSFETLDIYHSILNIIGRRLVDNPSSKLRIVGCNSDLGNEKGNKELSAKRANNIKEYLINVWDISESRIIVESRNLPEKASTPITDIEKSEENRRVEFYSDNYELLAPVFLADTLRTSNPPIIRFYPSIKSEAGVGSWSITANQESGNKMINFIKDGKDMPPGFIDWQVTGNSMLAPRLKTPVQYKLIVKDIKNNEISTQPKSINFELVTISKKRELEINDKIIENFSLILFDFDKSDIYGSNKKIVDFIKKRIKDKSSISIDGYTDHTGEEDYNKKLSEMRAISVRNAIGCSGATVSGIGKGKLLYDNNLPEGRFYCRTVDIKIETPVNK
jgi:outer membrane protein OmpA-like peptidoglycan-associated protein